MLFTHAYMARFKLRLSLCDAWRRCKNPRAFLHFSFGVKPRNILPFPNVDLRYMKLYAKGKLAPARFQTISQNGFRLAMWC